MKDFKTVYKAVNEAEALSALDFVEKNGVVNILRLLKVGEITGM